jgi:hypothetical protein
MRKGPRDGGLSGIALVAILMKEMLVADFAIAATVPIDKAV